ASMCAWATAASASSPPASARRPGPPPTTPATESRSAVIGGSNPVLHRGSSMRALWCPLVLFSLGLLAAGCGGDGLPPLHPVKGKVVHKGKAVEGGFLQFRSVKEQDPIMCNGAVGADGTFELNSVKGNTRAPGVPEGTYQVIYSPPPADQTKGPLMLPV